VIQATNEYGESSESLVGIGATILLVPDAPINLQDTIAVTSDEVAAFTWVDGITFGGSPIIDYRILYDQSINDFIVLEENIVPQTYETKVTLTKGAEYKFKV